MYQFYLTETLQIPACRRARSAALIRLAPAARSPPPEADAPQSRHLWNELQLGARRAVPRGWQQPSRASARQRRRPARRVQSPPRHASIHFQCVPHERLGHTARVFERKRAGQE